MRQKYLVLKDTNEHLLRQLENGQQQLDQLNVKKEMLDEVSSIGNHAFCLFSRIFAKTSRISGKIKFAENRDGFQLHADILWIGALRKRTLRATALFLTPSDRIVDENRHGNLIVKAPHSAIWYKMCLFLHVNRRQRRRESSVPHFFQSMLTPIITCLVEIKTSPLGRD